MFHLTHSVLTAGVFLYCIYVAIQAAASRSAEDAPVSSSQRIPGLKTIIIVGVILLTILIIFQLVPEDVGTVYLKKGAVVNGNQVEQLSGAFVKREAGKYVTVRSESGQLHEISWDQIASISLYERRFPARAYRGFIDSLDLLSKFGIFAGLAAFFFTLKQYAEGQKWKREEFLADVVKEFNTHPDVRNAKQMLDSLQLYGDRMIKLFPDADTEAKKYINVSSNDIYDALDPDKPSQALPDTTGMTDEEKAAAFAAAEKSRRIADCFDLFLSYLGRFAYYIHSGLVKKEELSYT